MRMDLINPTEVTDELMNFFPTGEVLAVFLSNFPDTARTSVAVDVLRYGADLLVSRGASSTRFSQFSNSHNTRSQQTDIPFERGSRQSLTVLIS